MYELCKSGRREEIKGKEAGVAWIKERCQDRESKVLEELGLYGAMQKRLKSEVFLTTSHLFIYPQIHGECR